MSKKSNEHEEGFYEAQYKILANAVFNNVTISVPSWVSKDILETTNPKYSLLENCYIEWRITPKELLKIFNPDKLDELLLEGLNELKNRKDE